jgi:hypothetical protein
MKKLIRPLMIIAAIAGALFLVGCPERTTIGDIERNPSKYQNKEVAIAGRVTDSYGINVPGTPIRGGAYKIEDGTGSIWVMTEEGVPSKGVEVGVKGIVGNGVNWKGRNYGLGMYEKDRRFRKR